MALPESFIEELKYRSDIAQTISSYVNLKRAGRMHKGLCPFHSEKSPSFTVYNDSQSFYCFGCGAGGDVVTFIKKIENLEYIEALKFLAEKNGITFPEQGVEDKTIKLKQDVLAINREAARFYYNNLKSPQGEVAKEYLLNRGLTGKTIGSFGIGVAFEAWDHLYKHLKGKGYTDYAIHSAGLINSNNRGGYYDVFRNRIIFPIMDLRGNVIGFGGRNMGDKGPKYLNSSDTPAFKKSRNLFALNFAKKSVADGIILAEGYMDVIALHQGGFPYSVATLGTALTAEQARIIASYTGEVIIAYDSDEAGVKATQRAIKLLEETGVNIRVLTLEGAKDPDEYIKKFGAARFKLLLEGSAGSTDYGIEKLKKKYNLQTSEGKVNFIKEFCVYIGQLNSPVERDIYISKIASQLEVDKQALKEQVATAVKRKTRQQRYERDNSLQLYNQPVDPRKDPQRSKFLKYAVAEDKLLGALIKNPDYYDRLKDLLQPKDFLTDKNREILEIIYSRLSSGQSATMMDIAPLLQEDQLGHISGVVASVWEMDITLEEAIDYTQRIKEYDNMSDPNNIVQQSEEDILKYIQGLKK